MSLAIVITNEGSTRMLNVTVQKTVVLLVVEDDREMRSLLCDEFWSAGYQLREAKDGDEAFLAVLRSVPDVILTDLRMPAGGADYISRLRTVAPHCPIIVMTAFGDAGLRADVLQAGASAYFDKPVRISDLKLKVEELLTDYKRTTP
jgi:DNA-binding response OmpR family regulator